jgi:hypothetical protein
MAIGAGVGFAVEAGFQIHERSIQPLDLLQASLEGALGGSLGSVRNRGGRAAGALLLGSASVLSEGVTDPGELVIGGILGVFSEEAAGAVVKGLKSEGFETLRDRVFSSLEGMIQAGRNAEDVIRAAVYFDYAASETGANVGVGAIGEVGLTSRIRSYLRENSEDDPEGVEQSNEP